MRSSAVLLGAIAAFCFSAGCDGRFVSGGLLGSPLLTPGGGIFVATGDDDDLDDIFEDIEDIADEFDDEHIFINPFVRRPFIFTDPLFTDPFSFGRRGFLGDPFFFP